MRSYRRVLAVVAAAALMLVGVDAIAYSATGGSVILGKVNKAGAPTTIRNTGTGPAMSFLTRATAPPFAVSSTSRVRRLNADMVDGWNSSELISQAFVLTDDDTTTVHTSPGVVYSLEQLQAGRYLVTWQAELSATETSDRVFCGLAPPDLTDLLVGDLRNGLGGSMPSLMTGAAVVDFDPATMVFLCGTSAASLRLVSPLTVAFQPIALAQDLELTPRPAGAFPVTE